MPRFWAMSPPEEAGGPSELRIEGEIIADDDAWWYDWIEQRYACPDELRAALADAGDVRVLINSPGGDVIAGSCMYTALRDHSARGHRVTVCVEGLAASAASVIAMAGDVVEMSPTAYLMIHDPWTQVAGSPAELREYAAQLDVIAEGVVEAYRLRTGMSRAHIRELMQSETWLSARQAVRMGFADRVLYADAVSAGDDAAGDVEDVSAATRVRWQMRAVACIRAHSPVPRRADGAAPDDTTRILMRERLRLLAM